MYRHRFNDQRSVLSAPVRERWRPFLQNPFYPETHSFLGTLSFDTPPFPCFCAPTSTTPLTVLHGTGVIDRFLEVLASNIDSGFGLLGGEVAFLATTLIDIGVTLAALFWAWGADDDTLARLIKKTLSVGAFAYIISNWSALARIVFESFAGLGLQASGTGFGATDLMRPGHVAEVGLDTGQPILASISDLMGDGSFFENFIQIVVLTFAWAMVLLAFFILSGQLFITLIAFKLTTLAGFVLIPFGLFGKTAFLAERLLGDVVSSCVKVLVLVVIIGIGSSLFGEFTAGFGGDQPNIKEAMAIVLAALSLLGLGIFGPGIANGLISGGPQLSMGAAVGTGLVAGAAGRGVVAGARGGAATVGGPDAPTPSSNPPAWAARMGRAHGSRANASPWRDCRHPCPALRRQPRRWHLCQPFGQGPLMVNRPSLT